MRKFEKEFSSLSHMVSVTQYILLSSYFINLAICFQNILNMFELNLVFIVIFNVT